MQRAPILGDIERRVPVLLNQDRGQFFDFLIGHPKNVKPVRWP